MRGNQQVSARGLIVALQVLLNGVLIQQALIANPGWYWLLIITVPLFLLSIIGLPSNAASSEEEAAGKV